LLLVDDHEEVRATTAILLKDLGHQVTEAAGGSEVLDKLRADPTGFDCVVSDYAMPDISGTEVVRQARSIRHALPAILITGYADSRSIRTLPSDVRVLTKPFTPDELDLAIGAAIKAACNEN
jgi:CheY-like chemotaxis protein